jgi:hypothetical protein
MHLTERVETTTPPESLVNDLGFKIFLTCCFLNPYGQDHHPSHPVTQVCYKNKTQNAPTKCSSFNALCLDLHADFLANFSLEIFHSGLANIKMWKIFTARSRE